METLKFNRDKRINVLIKAVRKVYGVDAVKHLGKDEVIAWPFLSTGLISVDNILGIGGVPLGRSVEVFGPEAAGKTTFCLHLVAQAQMQEGIAVYIDAEHALDLNYAIKIGVDTKSLLLCQPDSAEQALDMVEKMVSLLGKGDIVVLDSVAAMVPQEELDKSTGDWQMGLQARLLGKAIRKCTGIIGKNQVVVLWVNQLRDNIGSFCGGESTPGGRALKFGASIRMDIRRSGKLLDSKGVEYGSEISVKTLKNKMACPFLKTKIKLIYGEGFSKESSLIDEAIKVGVIKQSGSWYSCLGENVQGTESIRDRMKSDKEYFNQVEESVKEAIKPKKVIELSKEEKKKLTDLEIESSEEEESGIVVSKELLNKEVNQKETMIVDSKEIGSLIEKDSVEKGEK